MNSATVIAPILAENYRNLGWGFALFAFGIPLLVLFLAFAAICVNAVVGRRRWWGLILGLSSTAVGCLLLWNWFPDEGLHTIVVYPIFYSFISIPLICGIISLLLWRLPRID